MGMGRIVELLSTRYSVRQFQDRPVPTEVLDEMLEAGRLSPSGGNEQPWAFGVVTDRDLIERIAQIAYGQLWIAGAPLLIVLCTIGVDDDRGGRDIQKQRFPEHAGAIGKMNQELYWALTQEEHQTKIAGAHMALAAWEHGVGSCWVSRFEVGRLARLLSRPAGWLPSEMLAFGYAAQARQPATKKPLEEVVFYDAFRGIR